MNQPTEDCKRRVFDASINRMLPNHDLHILEEGFCPHCGGTDMLEGESWL